jgi:hypothetical protein
VSDFDAVFLDLGIGLWVSKRCRSDHAITLRTKRLTARYDEIADLDLNGIIVLV